jgi:hypothetical protein
MFTYIPICCCYFPCRKKPHHFKMQHFPLLKCYGLFTGIGWSDIPFGRESVN